MQPVAGRSLKIELLDVSTNKDAFGGIVELGTASENASTGADRIRDGTLSIVEVECYRRVR